MLTCTTPTTRRLQQIQPFLELDHQYTRHVEAWNDDLAAQIRRCGRAAGSRLGYKIRTVASDPRDRDDRRIVVWVVVTASNPDDEDRIHQRGELLVQETLNKLLD
jgi:DNA-binding IclR family transcriptional regulator